MLFLIGLGLGDLKDITLKGLEIIKKSDIIFLEHYTSVLCDFDHNEISKFYGKEVILADREMVEENSDQILNNAKTKNISFLVVGDVFSATTHSDLVLRAHDLGIKYEIVHNASIINAVGSCGLQLYRFGETVSIPFWTDTWKPTSFFDKIISNIKRNLHTLCLLDIKIKEKSIETIIKKINKFESPRFMTINIAVEQILEIIKKNPNEIINENSMCVGLSRVASKHQKIKYTSLKEMKKIDLGEPLHSLIITGELHHIEKNMLNIFN